MSVKYKKYVIGIISSLFVAGVISAAGWMTSIYNRVTSLDQNTLRTNEILMEIKEYNKELGQEVKTNTSFTIRHEERNNEQDRRLADHQRQLERINQKGQGG